MPLILDLDSDTKRYVMSASDDRERNVRYHFVTTNSCPIKGYSSALKFGAEIHHDASVMYRGKMLYLQLGKPVAMYDMDARKGYSLPKGMKPKLTAERILESQRPRVAMSAYLGKQMTIGIGLMS